jgi:flavin reductase/cob(II)yrinic acid a,c-diamide reductase
VEAAAFREAMRLTASGVAVVTSEGEAGRAGLTVSSLCSLSMDPPAVVFCVNRENRGLQVLLDNGVFVANVLSHAQVRVAESFAGLIPELREDRFAAAAWSRHTTGAPLLEGALCNFDCRVETVFDFASHRIIVGVVVGLRTDAAEPLVFSRRSFQRLVAV